jgi:hypothetical protein
MPSYLQTLANIVADHQGSVGRHDNIDLNKQVVASMVGSASVNLEDLAVVGQRDVGQLLQEGWISRLSDDELDLLY